MLDSHNAAESSAVGNGLCADESVIDLSAQPTRSEGVDIRAEAEEDGMYVCYVAEPDCVFMINSTGRLLWNLCDGYTTVADIVQKVASEYEVPSGIDLQQELIACLTVMSRVKMISIPAVENGK